MMASSGSLDSRLSVSRVKDGASRLPRCCITSLRGAAPRTIGTARGYAMRPSSHLSLHCEAVRMAEEREKAVHRRMKMFVSNDYE